MVSKCPCNVLVLCTILQGAKDVVSCSLGLVDFAIRQCASAFCSKLAQWACDVIWGIQITEEL